MLRILAQKQRKTPSNCQVSPMIVSDSGKRIEFDVTMGETKHHIYYSAKGTELTANPETSIAAALLPLMMNGGGNCEITGAISERFLTSIEQVQEIYYAWEPNSQRVAFKGDISVVKKQSEGTRTGAFFFSRSGFLLYAPAA